MIEVTVDSVSTGHPKRSPGPEGILHHSVTRDYSCFGRDNSRPTHVGRTPLPVRRRATVRSEIEGAIHYILVPVHLEDPERPLPILLDSTSPVLSHIPLSSFGG